MNNSAHDNNTDSLSLATRAIHCGQSPQQWTSRALIPPIVNATTFELNSKQLFENNGNQNGCYDYSRTGNPTRHCLERAVASLESAKHALCFSSGMSSITTVGHLLKSGEHVLCFEDIYGGTHRYFNTCLVNYGIRVQFIDFTDIERVNNALRPNTTMLWFESPSNPLMRIVDMEALVSLRNDRAPNALIVCDNTFMSPVFQSPLKYGVDIVVHSLTKYVNGHADAIMGAIATNRKDLYESLKYLQNALGTVPSPIDCYLVNRGLKTLTIRMEKHQQNGFLVAQFLQSHPMVIKVLHSGLKSHPQHDLAQKQCTGFSGMISFYLRGNSVQTQVFLNSLQLFKLVVSLGSVESRVEIPARMSHASVPPEHLTALGINDSLVRLSVGIENSEDLISDLKRALDLAQQSLS